jgi:hypothetical protein
MKYTLKKTQKLKPKNQALIFKSNKTMKLKDQIRMNPIAWCMNFLGLDILDF